MSERGDRWLSDEAAAEVASRVEHHFTSPYAARDEDALRRDAVRDEQTILRPAFQRDVEKILNVPAYNRLAGKTQVFSFSSNDDVTRRGLHVQLVARVARDIGRALGLNLELIEAIGLGHDIGHTPFGHAGERFLNQILHERCGRYFFHNVHSVRVLDALYHRNLTLQTLDGALCHNGEYERRRFTPTGLTSFAALDGALSAATHEGDRVVSHLVPMTLEGCVVRISDIIAYVGKDRADAIRAHHVAAEDFHRGLAGDYNAFALGYFIADIVEHSLEGTAKGAGGHGWISMSDEAFLELARAKRENYATIYQTTELSGETAALVEELFRSVWDTAIGWLEAGDESSPIFRHHIMQLERESGYYGQRYDWESDFDQTCVDYLASMSDNYFLALAERIDPQLTAKLPSHPYFHEGG